MKLRVLRHHKNWYLGEIIGKLVPYDPTKNNNTKWIRVPESTADAKSVIRALRRELTK